MKILPFTLFCKNLTKKFENYVGGVSGRKASKLPRYEKKKNVWQRRARVIAQIWTLILDYPANKRTTWWK